MAWLIWFLLLLALLAVIQGRYYGKHARDGLSYRRRLDRATAQVAQTVVLEEEVFNDKLIPLPWLRAEYNLSTFLRMGADQSITTVDDRRCRSVFQPGAYSRITRQHTITCLRRGVYALGQVSLSAGDLLGLSIQHWGEDQPLELLVYPKLLALDQLPEAALQWQGAVAVHRWIYPDPILVRNIRDYLPGDHRRDVHWRATARAGSLQVKAHDHTVQPRVLIALNITPFAGFWGSFSQKEQDELEYAVSMAATLCMWAWEQGMELGFCTNAEGCEAWIAPARSPGQKERILRTLALLRAREAHSFSHTLQQVLAHGTRRTDVLALSAWWDGALQRQAQEIRRRENSMTHLSTACSPERSAAHATEAS